MLLLNYLVNRQKKLLPWKIENNSTNQASQSKNKSNITDKKDKTSSVLNSKTKSLLGELYNNQGKLSEINKTADLGKNMTKTPEVSL